MMKLFNFILALTIHQIAAKGPETNGYSTSPSIDDPVRNPEKLSYDTQVEPSKDINVQDSCATLGQQFADEAARAEQQGLTGAFLVTNVSELGTDTDLENAYRFGVSSSVSQAISQGNLPNGQYSVTQVRNIYSQVVQGMNYRFDVDVANDEGLTARIIFVVLAPLEAKECLENTLECISVNNNS